MIQLHGTRPNSFRRLDPREIEAVAGGVIETYGITITVVGNLPGFFFGGGGPAETGGIDTHESLAPDGGGGGGSGLLPILPTYEQLQEALRVIAEAILNALGYDVIDLEDQATLNQELNGKDQAFTIPADGDSPRVTFTRDGTAFRQCRV